MIENLEPQSKAIIQQLKDMQARTGMCVVCQGYGEKAGFLVISSDHPEAEA